MMPNACPGHPLADIPIAELRAAACQAIRSARDETIAGFRTFNDDDTPRPAAGRRADLLDLASRAGSRQALADLLLVFQGAGDWPVS